MVCASGLLLPSCGGEEEPGFSVYPQPLEVIQQQNRAIGLAGKIIQLHNEAAGDTNPATGTFSYKEERDAPWETGVVLSTEKYGNVFIAATFSTKHNPTETTDKAARLVVQITISGASIPYLKADRAQDGSWHSDCDTGTEHIITTENGVIDKTDPVDVKTLSTKRTDIIDQVDGTLGDIGISISAATRTIEGGTPFSLPPVRC